MLYFIVINCIVMILLKIILNKKKKFLDKELKIMIVIIKKINFKYF